MIILISAANADVCLSMARIIKSDDHYKTAHLIGLTPDTPWPALQYFDEVLTIPMANSPEYPTALAEIIARVQPDLFIPFSEAELSCFAAQADMSETLSAKAVINPLSVLSIFLDKAKTSEFLKELGVTVPRSHDPAVVTSADLPVIMKPRSSAGSKNMAIIRNQAQLDGFNQQHTETLMRFVAQELIDVEDAEFTCALWRGGNTLQHCTLRRRLQGGMTGFARVEQHNTIDQALEKIAGAIEGDFFINVQLRMKEGIPYIFEINPRFSSTIMMRHKIGFKDFIWTLDRCFNRPAPDQWEAPLDTIIFRLSDECVVNAKGEII